MTASSFNVLFLCTGNTARSILAEAILRKFSLGKFKAFSAGSRPKGVVHPLTVKVLAAHGHSLEGLSSKNWEVFAAPDAPRMDFVITVCDNAAGETCPLWPGQPISAHWGIEDPAAVEGTEIEKERAFERAYRYLSRRVEAFAALPVGSLSRLMLTSELARIGRLEGASREAQGEKAT